MPKRSTHTFASEENAEPDLLQVYYCLYCGTRAMVIDADLSKLPKRNTDGAHVIVGENHTYRLLLQKGEHKLIKRAAGYERQFRMNCSKCDLPITYQNEREDAPNVFVIPNSLSSQPKVSFGDDDVPSAIQPTSDGEVRVSFTIVSKGDRCSIKRVQGDTVEVEIKDVEDSERANQLFSQYIWFILGCTKTTCTLDFGKLSRNKVYLIKDQTTVNVYKKLCHARDNPTGKFYKATGANFIKGEV